MCFLLLLLSPPPFAIGQNLCQWEGKCVDYGCPYGCPYDTEPECACTSPKKFVKFFNHDGGNANPLA
ncbi:hypothetical protein niasHS_008882 [Heterodera schachtii]|uniref:Uncharacterized protein n=1 Tax=Heterodera schachtii TaxID=97005 RepID=A0ABD2J268_HETSC